MESSGKILLQLGDITQISVDAIVNAANGSLMGGGGVDGAIHRAGGSAILEECKQIVARQGRCETGNAVITTAGKLPAKYVIHTVGPVWRGGQNDEEKLLASCYRKSLQLGIQHNCYTFAFPCISTGVYGFPKDLAAKIAVSTISEFLKQTDKIEKVILLSFDEENYGFLKKELSASDAIEQL